MSIGIVPPWLQPGPYPLPGPRVPDESSPVPPVRFLAGGGPQWAAGGRPAPFTLVNTSGGLWDGVGGVWCVASSWSGDSIHSVPRAPYVPTTR